MAGYFEVRVKRRGVFEGRIIECETREDAEREALHEAVNGYSCEVWECDGCGLNRYLCEYAAKVAA